MDADPHCHKESAIRPASTMPVKEYRPEVNRNIARATVRIATTRPVQPATSVPLFLSPRIAQTAARSARPLLQVGVVERPMRADVHREMRGGTRAGAVGSAGSAAYLAVRDVACR